MQKITYRNSWIRILLMILFIFIGIFIPIILNRFRIPEICDEPYMFLNVLNYSSSPIAPLSFYLGDAWCRIFGLSLFSLRCLASVCEILAVAIGCLWFYNKYKKPLFSAMLFCCLSLVMNRCFMSIFNWDTADLPWIMLNLVLTLSYYQKKGMMRAAALGFISALLIGFRLPLITLFPFVIIVLFIHNEKKRAWRDFFYLFIFFCIGLATVFFLVYGSLEKFESAWQKENFISGHSIKFLIENWIPWTIKIAGLLLKGWLLGILCLLATWITYKYINHKWVFLVGCVIILIAARYVLVYSGWSDIKGLYQPLTLGALFYPQICCVLNRDNYQCQKKILVPQLIVLLFILITTVGSDCTIFRLNVIPIFPIALSFSYSVIKKYLKILIVYLLLVSFSATIPDLLWSYKNLSIEGNKYRYLKNIVLNSEYNLFLSQCQEIVNDLENKGLKVCFIGGNKYAPMAFIGPDKHYAFQHFHYMDFNTEKDIYFKHFLDYDAFIVISNLYNNPEEQKKFDDYMKANGYEYNSINKDSIKGTYIKELHKH